MNQPNDKLNILFIDNFDSFVFNLVDEFEKRQCNVEVWRNDIPVEKALALAANMKGPKLVVLSPGPGTPDSAGCCLEFVKQAPADLPIFGVCLGHQTIIQAIGGEVGSADEIVHGKASCLTHTSTGVFEGIPSPVTVGRYHSLVGKKIPDGFRVTAKLDDMVMACEHKIRRLWSVQFHPESILTPAGGLMIDNIIGWATQKN